MAEHLALLARGDDAAAADQDSRVGDEAELAKLAAAANRFRPGEGKQLRDIGEKQQGDEKSNSGGNRMCTIERGERKRMVLRVQRQATSERKGASGPCREQVCSRRTGRDSSLRSEQTNPIAEARSG